MDRPIAKVVPSVELLKEMEELKIMGGFDPHPDADVYGYKCEVNHYTGNCVTQCACTGNPPS